MAAFHILSVASQPCSKTIICSQQYQSQACSISTFTKLDTSNVFSNSSNFRVDSRLRLRSRLRVKKAQCVAAGPCRAEHLIPMSLPTANPERASTENPPKWSEKAIKAFSLGRVEARKMFYPITGTEALLMGILTEGTSPAARFLWANGVTLYKVREEIMKLLGRGEPWIHLPEAPPLTKTAQKALDWAVDEKIKSGESGEVTTTHMLLGIWAQKGSTGQVVLANLGFDDKKAEKLAKSVQDDALVSSK